MLPGFVGSSFAVLVGWPLEVAFLVGVCFALWDGVHQLEGDCPTDLIDAMKRVPVES